MKSPTSHPLNNRGSIRGAAAGIYDLKITVKSKILTGTLFSLPLKLVHQAKKRVSRLLLIRPFFFVLLLP